MNKVAFIASHHGSGSDVLFDVVAGNDRVDVLPEVVYDHPTTLMAYAGRRHRHGTAAGVWVGHLRHNHHLQFRSALSCCKFIYVLTPPVYAFAELGRRYKPGAAVRYYCHRLRRLYEMARRSGGVMLTWEDLVTGRGLPLVQEHLGLVRPLLPEVKLNFEKFQDYKILEIAEKSYDLHFHLLKNNLKSFV